MADRSTSARLARSRGEAALLAGLGDWSAGRGPLYRQLARAVAATVERGEQVRGSRLPAERSLSAALSVSRGVVVAAYDLLVADGVVERRRGSGTFVAAPAADLPPGREGPRLVGRLVAGGAPTPVVDLSLSVTRGVERLPDVTVRTATLDAVGADSPWGLPELRDRVARRLGDLGLPTTADQVVITTGAQQGITVAVGCWVRPGDTVVVDDPTYPGTLAALAAAGAEARPVPVDAHGPRLEPLRTAMEDRPAALYLQSGPHSPTGGRLSEHRRRVVAELVDRHRVPLIEDLALHALDWSGRPPPAPVAAAVADHPAAVVGSYSKRFWAGLRVGFVRAPEPVAQRLVRVKATHDLGSSTVGQAMALALLDHPDAAGLVARRNRDLAKRAGLAVDLLAAHLPSWEAQVPSGGLSLWVRLPRPVGPRLGEVALRHGVAVATSDSLSVTDDHHDRIRLTFAVAEPELRLGVERLATAWADLS